jgi:hypothetical protein
VMFEIHLRSSGDSPYGLLPPWRTQHLPTRSGAGFTRPDPSPRNSSASWSRPPCRILSLNRFRPSPN